MNPEPKSVLEIVFRQKSSKPHSEPTPTASTLISIAEDEEQYSDYPLFI